MVWQLLLGCRPACCISPALEPLIIAGTNICVAVGLSIITLAITSLSSGLA
jgi:hypothetical protein